MKLLMKTFLMTFFIFGLVVFTGCPQTTGETPAPDAGDEAVEVEAEPDQPADVESDTPPEPITEEESAVMKERMGELVIDFAEKLGIDRESLTVAVTNTVSELRDQWLIEYFIDSDNAPAIHALVRADLEMIEVFSVFPEYAPEAVREGELMAGPIIEALELGEMGFVPVEAIAKPGVTIARQYETISGHRVNVSFITIMSHLETRELISYNFRINDPLEAFEMAVTEEEAIEIAREYLEDETLQVIYTDIVQLPEEPMAGIEGGVYHEISFSDAYVYVMCSKGDVIVMPMGLDWPFGS